MWSLDGRGFEGGKIGAMGYTTALCEGIEGAIQNNQQLNQSSTDITYAYHQGETLCQQQRAARFHVFLEPRSALRNLPLTIRGAIPPG